MRAFPTDEATDEDWAKARRLWRRMGFVSTPMPDGEIVKADLAGVPLSANAASPPPPPVRKVVPARLPVVPPPVPDYKARAAGERDSSVEDGGDVPF